MVSKKRPEDELDAPSTGELDVLGVLWAERCGENRPLQLSEVHARVSRRRVEFGEPVPALTTVSTHLRNLVEKKLIQEVVRGGAPAGPRPRTRGGMTPPTRSPLTSYQALHEPGLVLRSTLCGLAAAYPDDARLQILVDLAQALDVTDNTLKKLEALVQAEMARTRKES